MNPGDSKSSTSNATKTSDGIIRLSSSNHSIDDDDDDYDFSVYYRPRRNGGDCC